MTDFRQHSDTNPFDLDQPAAYERWRGEKLADYPQTASSLIVEIASPDHLTKSEHRAIIERVQHANMALYAVKPGVLCGRDEIRHLGELFGLNNIDCNLEAGDDGISSLKVNHDEAPARYIPYTNRPINWHTDGYYNTKSRQIRGMVLHCASDSSTGGENALLDHEIAYIQIRDQDPHWIRALSHPRAMVIPANEDAAGDIRGEASGPVFSTNPADGSLHMRFTARTRSIVWRDDTAIHEAVAFLNGLLGKDNPYIIHHRMVPGQGLICNNVLHNRSGFKDDVANGRTRLLYRARYFDRIIDKTVLKEQIT